jgi:hypothetical protein
LWILKSHTNNLDVWSNSNKQSKKWNSNSNHEQINNESDKETQAIVYPVRPNKDLRLGERAALLSSLSIKFQGYNEIPTTRVTRNSLYPILPKSRISSRDQEIQLQVFPKVMNQSPTLEYCQDVSLITLDFCRLRINPKTLLKHQKTQNSILYPRAHAQAQPPTPRRSLPTPRRSLPRPGVRGQ